MKYCLFILALSVSLNAFAAKSSSRSPQALFEEGTSGSNHLYFQLIPYQGEFGFGFAYEKDMGSNIGLAGSFTYLAEDDEAPYVSPGLVSLSGQARLHYIVKSFDFYVAPGLNLLMMEQGDEDDTTIGASFAVGSFVQLHQSFAVGLELSAIQPWFNEEFFTDSRGYYFNSSLNARFTF
jgi:hypothetical protein